MCSISGVENKCVNFWCISVDVFGVGCIRLEVALKIFWKILAVKPKSDRGNGSQCAVGHFRVAVLIERRNVLTSSGVLLCDILCYYLRYVGLTDAGQLTFVYFYWNCVRLCVLVTVIREWNFYFFG